MTCRALLFALATLAIGGAAQAKRCPNVMFVVDRSGSMAQDPSGGDTVPSKWDLTRTAIGAVLAQYGARLAFGLEMFASEGVEQACYTDTRIDVLPAHGTAAMIEQLLAAAVPEGGTNTGEAIERAYTDGMLDDPSRGNYLVLITDGDPNCNAGDQVNAAFTVSQIADAAALTPSIHTFVVGFDGAGGGVNPQNLDAMAQAGEEPVPGCDPGVLNLPCYYSASTSQKFLAAIDQIVGDLAGGTVVGGCDDSCFSNPCPTGQICDIPTPGAPAACAPDPCAALTCDAGSYCKAGACLTPCPTCAAGRECQAEACVPDPCAAVTCPANFACDPSSGQCAANQCIGSSLLCPLPSFCDPVSGFCADDPCRLVNCPANATCYGGWCMTDAPAPVPDMSAPAADLSRAPAIAPDLATNDSGARQAASCAIGRPDHGIAPLSLLLIALVISRVARRRDHMKAGPLRRE